MRFEPDMAGFIHSVTLFHLHLQQTKKKHRVDLIYHPAGLHSILGRAVGFLNLKPLSLLQRIEIGV
jgi:hypothetical protein